MSSKRNLARRAISYQLIGFSILVTLIACDEVLDLPHKVLGAPATPINWTEAALESSFVLVLGAISIGLTWRLLDRLVMLEGLLPVCSFCKKIRKHDEWEVLEKYIGEHSEAVFSHGVCPECAEKYYGEFVGDDSP
ncbi:MAG TPA: hypothetical protein VFD74_09915 [Thermoleophilia bacterium]|nr:hypothetical protein [Thermoleophilia bacterium]